MPCPISHARPWNGQRGSGDQLPSLNCTNPLWPKARVLRTRSRRPRQLRRSKPRSHTRRSDIPPELRAPITGEIERELKQLVAEFGEKNLLEALDPLVTKCKRLATCCECNSSYSSTEISSDSFVSSPRYGVIERKWRQRFAALGLLRNCS